MYQGTECTFRPPAMCMGSLAQPTRSRVEGDYQTLKLIWSSTSSSALYCNKLILSYRCNSNRHSTVSAHAAVMCTCLDGIKSSTQGPSQSFVIKSASLVWLNWTFVPKSFLIYSLHRLAYLPCSALWARAQHPCVGHSLCLEPLWLRPVCVPLPDLPWP